MTGFCVAFEKKIFLMRSQIYVRQYNIRLQLASIDSDTAVTERRKTCSLDTYHHALLPTLIKIE